MIRIGKAISVMAFELKRSMSFGRLAAFAILSLFPPTMVVLISVANSHVPAFETIILFLSFIVLLLALLLWATPNVYAELENRNWIYISNRPDGRISLLLGKWMASSVAGFAVVFVSVTACWIFVILRYRLFAAEALGSCFGLWFKTLGLWMIASVNYAAVFSLIGVLFQRRAMVIATVFTLINECVLAFFPALVSKFSIRYQLVGIMLSWFGWILPAREPEQAVLDEWFLGLPLWANLTIVIAIPIASLLIAGRVIHYRQYITVDEA